MKILAIRIKNLASLEGTTEIDFTAEPLRSSGIFAITGATGAGKSTILDALCLALYGKTPRYTQARETGIEVHDVYGSTLNQGDVRGILRDGTADGFAEVDFRGTDGQDYRSTWSVRRARNKAEGSMQSDAITLKNITLNIDIPGKKQETLAEITRLVGLNYDQFIRSVLLAQGDFTAFMKATKDEKSSLLEKLTGTHIYSEISKKIYEKFKVEEQLLRDLNLKKEGVAILNDDEISVLIAEQCVLEAQMNVFEKEVENLNLEISWHQQLALLQLSYANADTALNVSKAVQTDTFPRKQKLRLTEQVQQTRSWADVLTHTKKQHLEKSNALATLKETITSLEIEKEKLEKQLLNSGAQLTAKNKAFDDALPLLAQAKKLDTLLTEKLDQLTKAEKEAENATEISNQQEKLLTAKQLELTNLFVKIESITTWKTENNDRSPIAENRDIIHSKLQDAQQLLDSLLSSTKELDVLKNKISTSETEKTVVEADLEKQTQQWEGIKKTYDIQSGELILTPIESLNQEKVELDKSAENMIRAQASWQILYNTLAELDALSQKQALDQSGYVTKQKTLEELAKQLLVENAQKETTAQLLQQARLATAENVETLRATLIDNEPCPVCGSESHPYGVHNPQLENVLAKLEEAFEEKERVYLVTYRQQNALEQAFETLKQTINTQSEAIEHKKTALEKNKQTWEQFDLAEESKAVADAKKAVWIEERIQTRKTIQAELSAKIQTYTSRKQKLEADKNKIDLLKETINLLKNQLQDIKSSVAVSQEQRNAIAKNFDTATLKLSEVEKTLSPYFNNSDWMENWKAAPTVFIDRIDAFAKKWKDNTDSLAQCAVQKSAVEATVKELESQTKIVLTEVKNKASNFEEQNKSYLNLRQQRHAIFAGESAEKVESELKLSATEAQKQLDQLKATKQQLDIHTTKSETQKDELTASLNILEKDAQKALEKIEDWLADYNKKNDEFLNIIQLQELLLLNNDWIDNERITLQAIDDEITKATSVLAERKQLLDAHQQKLLSERQLDQLNELVTRAKSDAELQKRKKAEIGFQLKQDKANKDKIGNLLKSITKQAEIAENWSKLNEIIGSADGKKFRQIAQEYTLDVLLGYANIHLEALTSRYKIERIPASLGLQVVDQDMGDEVRTVYSLSGGESFLVSLALALGLASLSSSRMKVESLFIDEGFGSLDPTTLNIAMDALERLHNQGRKVGVISHVQEMTERIPVQIKVSKQQSGKSMVEVVGF